MANEDNRPVWRPLSSSSQPLKLPRITEKSIAHTRRFPLSRLSRFSACSLTPAVDVSNATFELYPNNSTRALGSCFGRKSLSQSLSPDVHVVSAWNSSFVGFKPWTATMLFIMLVSFPTNVGRSRIDNKLNLRILSRYNFPQKVF